MNWDFFKDKKIKNMGKKTVARLTVLFTLFVVLFIYFVWKNPRDFEAWFLLAVSIWLALYCSWQLILKWDR